MEFGTLAVIAGALAAGWRYVMQVVYYIRSMVIATAVVNGPAAWEVISYIQRHGRFLKVGDRNIRSMDEFVRPLNRTTTVCWESIPTEPRVVVLSGSGSIWRRIANDQERIDPAIARCTLHETASRPGRIDRVFTLDRVPEQSAAIAKRIIGEHITDEDITAVLSMTAAQATEYAVTRAQQYLFADTDMTEDEIKA